MESIISVLPVFEVSRVVQVALTYIAAFSPHSNREGPWNLRPGQVKQLVHTPQGLCKQSGPAMPSPGSTCSAFSLPAGGEKGIPAEHSHRGLG